MRRVGGALSAAFVTTLGGLAGCGSGRDAGDVTLASEPQTAKLMAQPLLGAADKLLTGDGELRRGYGSVDMRFESCVTRETEYMLTGKGCVPGTVVYGPYVAVPAASQVEISFEVRPSKTVQVYADTVAQMGNKVLAGLSPQVVVGGQSQRLGYFINVGAAESNVESRIGFRSDAPVDFTLSNLTMTVR